MSTVTTHRTAPLWKFAEVSPPMPEFNDLTESDEVTFIPLEDVWPTNKADDFRMVPWEKRLNGYTPFRRGDLLLPKVTPTVTHGRTMITNTATELGVASTEVYTVRARPGADSRWLAYLLVGTQFLGLAGASVQGTGGLKRISTQFVESYPLPDASPDEQRAIADYLDRETAEIDAMTADLDKMEALLTERRSAVLTSTISRLSVKWPMPKLGTLVQMVSGSGFPHRLQGQEGKELPFYKVGSLSMTGSDGTIVDDRNSISREDAATLRARVIPGGSVLLAKIGAALLLGRFVRNAKPCCIDNNMLALIPSPKVDAKFLEHALSMVNIKVLERSGPVPTLDLGGLRQHRVPLPPLEEQHRIVDVIDRETAEIDAMLADITELRDLLAERRAALIAAAVTGQIDIPTAEEPTNA